ncbi:MAG: riboflavin synthase subunit beta [Bacteroidetes bacterium]|nr:riboflavin synthase subunit beta [Bacteroidota bacterium]MDA1176622.1 riboflavin synthase subunit beta [Bacteroidota bacterium]MDA8531480.1 riboflavin synthase subunit beta [Flavobacteriaceae bacterium]
MGLFKLRKNKKFNYEPRYYKGDSSPFEMKHKFDDQRVTVQKTNLKGTLKNALNDARHTDRATSRRIGFIIMVLVLVALWIIDFDLSLFFS